MENYPRNLMEFEQQFASEEACREYLFQLRWPNGFRCPRCQNQKAWKTSVGLYYCIKCKYKTSVIAGTIFQDTSKPLKVWFRAMWYVTNQKHGVSALGLQRMLGLGSYRTAWSWLHKLRRAMVRPGRDRLSGIVEVDEAYIGGPEPGKRGRGAAGKALVVIAAQKDGKRIGRICLKRVADASAKNLNEAVKYSVEANSRVRTDDWNGYNRLQKLGYSHEVIRKTSGVGKNLLPSANIVISLLKRWLLGIHQGAVKMSHLDYYLDEFTFRFNRRTSRSRGKLFYRLVQQAAEVEPLLINNISTGRSGNETLYTE
jgi:transposase-like protein/ribosomal protein L37AE/L43A